MDEKKSDVKAEGCCQEDSCCSTGNSCNCASVGGKALLVIIVFLLGGVIGYLMGINCASKKMCGPMMGKPCPMMSQMQQPATTK